MILREIILRQNLKQCCSFWSKWLWDTREWQWPNLANYREREASLYLLWLDQSPKGHFSSPQRTTHKSFQSPWIEISKDYMMEGRWLGYQSKAKQRANQPKSSFGSACYSRIFDKTRGSSGKCRAVVFCICKNFLCLSITEVKWFHYITHEELIV